MSDVALLPPPRNRSASLRRALTLLAAVGDRPGCSLGELATAGGVDKRTAARLLAPPCEAGLVETDERGRYHVGVAAVPLGQAYLERVDVPRIALLGARCTVDQRDRSRNGEWTS